MPMTIPDFSMDIFPRVFDPELYIPESFEFMDFWDDQYLQEATDGTTKQNVLSRLLGMIKRLCAIIAARCKQIGEWLSSFFRTKKVNDATMDQIVDSVFDDKIEPARHMQFRYENDQKITMNIVTNTVKGFIKSPEIAGHAKKDRPYQKAIVLVFHIIKDPSVLDPLIELFNSMKADINQTKISVKQADKAIDACWGASVIGLKITVTMEEWTRLNEKVFQLQKAMMVVDDDTFSIDPQIHPDFAKVVNRAVQFAAFVQLGVNTIAEDMRQVYKLDANNVDRINSKNFRDKLPKFVKACVKGNVPGKYIHYAVRQICDVSINSKINDPNTKADVNAPLTGNGRFVIFPSDPALKSKVIKVAYNGLGVRGNRNEFMVWNRVKDIPEIANQLYHIYDDVHDPEQYVITCDRAAPMDSWSGTDKWNKDMEQLCRKANVGFIIRCNSGGFAKRSDGSVVCVDYGNVERAS